MGQVPPDEHILAAEKFGASQILTTLGAAWFAEFAAVQTSGRVVWCNFELARTLGFAVPPSNRMTPLFHQQLIDTLSYRAVTAREAAATCRPTLTLYADRYGGKGLGTALGAGRAGFLPFGNLYVKGVGLTPLFRHDDPDDLGHNHGAVQLDHCLGEAMFGEVNHHLFTHGSTRILAIVDQGEYVVYRRGRKVAVALAVRSGGHLRPGHLLAGQIRRRRSILETFIRITRQTGQLVTRTDAASGAERPDIKATMIRIIDAHARTTAEHFRWRMTHGAVTSSNMEMSGATLDLTTQSAQPRTAPVYFRLDYESFFGHEHIDCAAELRTAYRALVTSIPKRRRRQLNARLFSVVRDMDRAYARHLEAQLLGATGLKAEVVNRVRSDHADLVRRFTTIISAMCELRNPGRVEMAKRVVMDVSVLDVLNLLREYPNIYFADPDGVHTTSIRAALKPVLRGNRSHVGRTRAAVSTLIYQFGRLYRELMNACGAYADDYYDDAAAMRGSITSRAAFENEPINLYRAPLYKELEEAIATYKSTGDADILTRIVDGKVAASLRRVDALLSQGRSRRLAGGGCELETQTMDGVTYALRAYDGPSQRRSLHVSVPVECHGHYIEIQLPGWPRLTPRHVRSLRYRFTTDGWATSQSVPVHLAATADDRRFIASAAISDLPRIARLAGAFYLRRSRGSWLEHEGATGAGYTFAVPDRQELAALVARLPEPR